MRFASHHDRKRVQSSDLGHAHAVAPRRWSGGDVRGRCPRREVWLLRSFVLALALSCIVITSVPVGAATSSIRLSTQQARAAVQADEQLAAAADVARELSTLEANRDF